MPYAPLGSRLRCHRYVALCIIRSRNGESLRCLFCKSDSGSSRSVEHILPESIGNTQHILPAGIVCDKCNNYFSREVEKPFLESPAMAAVRFYQGIESKRGVVPPLAGLISPGRFPVFAHRNVEGPDDLFLRVPSSEAFAEIANTKEAFVILPMAGAIPEGPTVSRFLAKVALEAMAERLLKRPEALDQIVYDKELDPIRKHARMGHPGHWAFNARFIYDPNRQWVDETGQAVQMVHESGFLVTDEGQFFFVVAIFGLELTINVGDTSIEGYHLWLAEHGNLSPLYWGTNAASGPPLL